MKVGWKTCDKQLGDEMKSANENGQKFCQKFTWKLPSVTSF